MSGYGEEAASLLDVRRCSLRADCERCFGLCCVAPAFSASADFAIDKDAWQPCPNLRPDFRCGIHARLREQGFPGCTAYDCFGAEQQGIAASTVGCHVEIRERVGTAEREVFGLVKRAPELVVELADRLERQGFGQVPEQLVQLPHG